MRVTLETSGGFAAIPGLHPTITIDSHDLATVEAARLWRLVTDADFFALPAHVESGAAGGADQRRYTLTVEDAAHQHTVTFTDPVENRALAAIRDYVIGHRAGE